MEQISTVQVLDIPLFNGSIEMFFKILKKDIESNKRQNRQVSFCDANVLVSSKDSIILKDTLINHTYLNMPDGMPGVWIGRLKGGKDMMRCYGPDLFKYVIENTANNKNIKHYLTGGKKGVAELLRKYCNKELDNGNIVGVHSPPFKEITENEIKEIAKNINSKKVDIVWIGISSPKQDLYARRLSKYLNVHFIFTIGAAFDFFTGNVKQAPIIMQKSGIEWLFRLIMEPKRLWKRYFRVIPLFIWYNIRSLKNSMILN